MMQLKRKAKRVLPKPADRAPLPKIIQMGFGTEMPPHRRLVEIYFDQKGFTGQADLFYSFYEQANWSSPKGTPYRNWKLLATDWIFDYEQLLKLSKRKRENMLVSSIPV